MSSSTPVNSDKPHAEDTNPSTAFDTKEALNILDSRTGKSTSFL